MIYKAIFEREATGVWTVELANLQGVHSWGRSIEQARSRLRDALAVWIEDAGVAREAILEEEFRLPSRVSSAVTSARELRLSAEAMAEQSQSALRRAARQLVTEQRLSVRDAAEILGVSFQRIHQLTASAETVGERLAKYRTKTRKSR